MELLNGLATLDLSSAITAAGANVASDFQTNLGAIVVIVLPVIFGLFIWRKVKHAA